MSNTIAINKSHANSDYSEYIYKLPQVMHFNEYDAISFVSCNVNYSWFNITALIGNNVFSYMWPTGTVDAAFIQYDITITDGYYSVTSLNEYIIAELTYRAHYMYKRSSTATSVSSLPKVFFIGLTTNSGYYAIQFIINSFPTATTTGTVVGYQYATSNDTTLYPTWIIPSTSNANRAPKIRIIENGMKIFLGFNTGDYPVGNFSNSDPSVAYKTNGQNAPMVENINEICIHCNLIQNIYSQNDTFFYSFSPAGYGIGEMVSIKPSFLRYDKINAGQYQYIKLKITDQDGNKIVMKEPFTSIQLSIVNSKI